MKGGVSSRIIKLAIVKGLSATSCIASRNQNPGIIWRGKGPDLAVSARDRLGDQFQPSEFHQVVLGNGNVPLQVLERLVNDYIEAETK